jgi:hypothetical protein
MKKNFYFSLILIILTLPGFAQPQFSYTQAPAAYNTIPFSNNMNMRQWLYYPSNFSGMPVGYISKIFIKAQTSVTPSFPLLTVRMGTTTLNNFASGPFAGSLTTVYQGSYSATTLPGNWLEITLQTPFYYDSLSNFIVECSQVGYSPGFNVMQTNSGVPGRSLAGYMTSTTGTMQNVVAQIGFEMQAASTPLAVKLKEFSLSTQNNHNLLSWVVSEEKDMFAYEVERSIDGVSYENIGLVYAEPQQSGENKYTFSDKAIPSVSASGKVMYRLRMTDLSGEETFSSTVVSKLSERVRDFTVNAFPVPFNRNLTLAVTLTEEQDCSVTVRNVMGMLLAHKIEHLYPGTTNLNLREIDHLPPGTYFITSAALGNQKVVRVIKY